MRRRSGLSASPRAFLTALLVCKWVEAASADLGSYATPLYGGHHVGYQVSDAITSGAVYGRRLQAELGSSIDIAGIGPYLPPSVHVPPGGLGRFGRKLAAYYETSGAVTYTSGAVVSEAYAGRRLLSYGYPTSGAITSGAILSDAVPSYAYGGRRRLQAYGAPYSGAITFTSGAIKPYGFRRLHAYYDSSGAVTTTSGAVTSTSGAVSYGGRRLQQYAYQFPPSGAVTVPSGAVTVPSGAVMVPSGAVMVPSGAVMVPSGAIRTPSGAIMVPSGAVLVPPGAAFPPGATIVPVYGPAPPPLEGPTYAGRRLSVLQDPPLSTGAQCYPSLLNTVTSTPDITDFLILLSKFGLSSYLDQPGTSMTLFAPTNTALAAAGLDVRSTSSAETLLMNHIVPDLQLPAQLTAPVSADSLAGFVLTVIPMGAGGIQVTSGSSTASSLGPADMSCHGTAYVIDHVLSPPSAAAN